MIYHATEAARPMPCNVPWSVVLFEKAQEVNDQFAIRPPWFEHEKPKKTGFYALTVKQRRELLVAQLSSDKWTGTDAIHAATGANRCGILKALHRLANAGTILERGGKGLGYEWKLRKANAKVDADGAASCAGRASNDGLAGREDGK